MNKYTNYQINLNGLRHRTIFKNDINKTIIQEMRPCLFLDRDGVIIEDCDYLSNPNKVKILDGAKELIEIARRFNWIVVIVTNQSGIFRGYFEWDEYESVNNRMIELIDIKFPFDAIYANGYGPKASATSWRKPSAKMLLTAKQDLKIDLSKSILIGDRLSDLVAGTSAGLKMVVHVQTGHGERELSSVIKNIYNEKESSNIESPIYFKKDSKCSELLLLKTLLDIPSDLLIK